MKSFFIIDHVFFNQFDQIINIKKKLELIQNG